MLLRMVCTVAAASALFLASASGAVGVDETPPFVVDVGPHEAMFAGAVAASVVRPADRLEIVLVGPPESDGAAHGRVTATLQALAQGTLPNATVRPLPTPAALAAFPPISGPAPLPGVRIRLPMPTTDVALRESVSRILAAANSRRYGADTLGAQVISIDHIYTGCTPFDAPIRGAAQTRVEQLARGIGMLSATAMTLQRLPAAGPFEASVAGATHCSDGNAIFPDPSLPSTASYRYRQAFAFAQPIRFARTATVPRGYDVRALWSGPTEGPRLKLRSSAVLLTIEGSAVLERQPLGTLYTYVGPNGRWSMADVTLESLAALGRRLKAVGVGDRAMVLQLHPDDGRLFVQVRSPDVRRNDAIAAAIAGTVKREREAILTTALSNTCAEEEHALARAVADAQARAQRIAIGVGAPIDLEPVAVRTGGGNGFASCADRGVEYALPTPDSDHIAGYLQRSELDNDAAVTAFVTFRIGQPRLSGVVRSRPANDDPTSITARFGYVAPPFDYPDATQAGEAQLQTRLRPRRIRIDMTLSPDNRHGFHAIDPSLATGLAGILGASAAEYSAAFVPDADRGGGEPTPSRLIFEAVLPNRGSATEAALNTALTSAQAAGYGGFSIVAESDSCADVADSLALDAIRAAARSTSSKRTGRVVAIDLRGPFTVDGLCGPTNSGVATWAIRNATIKDVRLAAYARVSYGHR